jgi:hypothetical protein
MATHEFYSIENRHNERQIRILSVGSLVSKPPTKEKRISIKVRMPLSGTINMGAPEWLDNIFIFVSKNHDMVTPDIEFKGYSIGFNADNLFGAEGFNGQECTMKGFQIYEAGDAENPDVVMDFSIRLQFATKRWDWLGQYVGDDVWCKFTPGESGTAQVDTEQDGTLLDDGENDEDDGVDPSTAASDQLDEEDDLDPDNETEGFDPELDKPEELEYESGPALVKGKSGPKDLAAFHEQVVEGEVKRGRGRPRKVPAGFDKPLHSGNEF